MKKRVVFLVLAVLLVLGLATAAAAENGSTGEGAYLAFRQAEWNSKTREWFLPEDPNEITDFTMQLDSNMLGQVVLCEGSTITPIALNDLKCGGAAFLQTAEDQAGSVKHAVRLSVKGCGTGSVSYEKAGNTYTLSFESILPDVGFYSTSSAAESGYLTSFALTATNQTFYLVARDGVTISDVKLEDDFAAIATISPVESSTNAWKITITGEPDDNWYELSYTVNNRTRYQSIEISDARPGLRFRYAKYDRDTHSFYIPANGAAENTFSLSLDSNHVGRFYYWDGSTETALQLSELTWNAYVDVTLEDGSDNMLCIAPKKCGAGAVQYKRGNDTYSFSIPVSLPTVSFYSGKTASEDTLLEEFGVSSTNRTFYLVAQDGWEFTSLTLSDELAAIATAAPVGSTGLYEITVTGAVTEGYYTLSYRAEGANGASTRGNARIYLYDNEPQLLCRFVNSNNGQLMVQNTLWAWSQLPSELGGRQRVCLYYGTKQNYRAIDDSLGVTDSTILTATKQALNETTDYFILEYKKCGKTTLTFTVGGKTHTQDVTVALPDPGFFASRTRSEAAYCANGIDRTELTDGTLWVLKEGGFTNDDLRDLTITFDGKAFTAYEMVRQQNGNYDLKLTLPEVTPDETKHLYVSGNGFSLGSSVGEFHYGNAAEVGGYVIGWVYTDPDSGISTINEGNSRYGTESMQVADDYSENVCWDLQLAAGIKKTDAQNNTYYELVGSDQVGLSVKWVWIESFYGEEDCFSLSSKAFKKELTRGLGTNVKLYYKLGHTGWITLHAELEITVKGRTTTKAVSVVCFNKGQQKLVSSVRPANDTVEALNAYLQSLVDAGLRTDTSYQVTLANTEYVGTIVIPKEFFAGPDGYSLSISGAGSGDGTAATILRGAVNLNGSATGYIGNVHFKATESCKTAAYGGALLNMSCCSFEGYDVAVDATTYCIVPVSGNVFVDNKIAVRVNLAANAGNVNQTPWRNNTFVGNDIAVQIKSLGQFFSAYYFRILDSNFIGNGLDFDMHCAGTLYMYRNYFSQVKNHSDTLLHDLWMANSERRVNDLLTCSTPKIRCVNGSRVITNPRCLLPVANWWKSGASIDIVFPSSSVRPAALAQEESYENRLVSDWSLDTCILNEEADDLMLDASAFESKGEKEIEVLDKEGASLGTWSFDGKDAT